ncbi:MAG: SLC13 family permease [Coriobacteriales bacterium]|nr:SLC13 family permease [Coriobacteriales bacterium]
MDPNTTIIVVVLALAATIILCFKFKNLNIGVLAFFFAMLIGYIVGGTPINTLLQAWPSKVLFTLIAVPVFFSYAGQNGTVTTLAQKLMYRFRGASWALPLVMWGIAYIISALGAGSYATVILLGPIVWVVSKESGLNPMIGLGLLVMANIGGAYYWTGGAAITASFMEIAGVEAANAMDAAIRSSFATQPLGLGVVIVLYLVLRGWRAKPTTIEAAPKFNKKQLINLVIIFCVVGISLVSMILGTMVPSPITKWMFTHLDVRVLCLAASILCAILGLGDTRKVIQSVPWNTVFMVSGVAILMDIALKAGLSAVLASWITGNIPLWLVPTILLCIAGLMSLFSSALSVVCPTLIPIAVALCAASPELNAVECITAIMAGSSITGCSPFSAGGSLFLSTCPDSKQADDLVPRQFGYAFIFLAIEMILCLLGVMKPFGAGFSFIMG